MDETPALDEGCKPESQIFGLIEVVVTDTIEDLHPYKKKFENRIKPNYTRMNMGPETCSVEAKFNKFANDLFATLPDYQAPENHDRYYEHMGHFVHHLDVAKDEWMKGLAAFYSEIEEYDNAP